MRRIEDEEIKPITFEVLKHVKELCDAEGIRYFLAYGTALGALRHSGFIPWDDDVDVYMLRSEFERYVAADAKAGGRYRLVCTENQPGYTLPLPKVIDTKTLLHQTDQIESFELGVYVDVFVLDAVPAEESERKSFYRKLDGAQKGWSRSQYAPTEKTNLARRAGKAVLRAVGPRHYSVKIDEISKAEDAKGVTGLVCPSTYCVYGRERETYPISWFTGEERIHEFSGVDFSIPPKAEDYLSRVYGDWEQLPPVEERKSHHCFEAFWRESDE